MGYGKWMKRGITLVVVILISACGAEKTEAPASSSLQAPTFTSYRDYRAYVKGQASLVENLGKVNLDRDSLLAGDQSEVIETVENLVAIYKKYDLSGRGYQTIRFAEKRQMTNTQGVVVLNYGANVDEIEKFLSAQPTKTELLAMQRQEKEDNERLAAAQAAQAAEEARRRAEADRPRRDSFGRP